MSGVFHQNNFPHPVWVAYLTSGPQHFPRPRSASRLKTTLPVFSGCCGFTKVFLQLWWKAYFNQLSHWVKKKTEGDTLRVAKPTKGKCAQYKAAFVSRWRLKSWILRRHESVGMFSVHKRWRQATDFSSLMLIPKQTVKCTLWFPSQSTV